LRFDSLDRIFLETESGHVQLQPILMTIFWGLVAHSKMVTISLADLATMAPPKDHAAMAWVGAPRARMALLLVSCHTAMEVASVANNFISKQSFQQGPTVYSYHYGGRAAC
jgi:hypothetical protein